MAFPTTPVDRRTVLAGAAWAVPVIAVAVAAPAAAASTGTLEIDFVALVLQLKRSDTIAAVIAITNTGTVEAADQTVSVTLTGLETPADQTYLVEFGPVLGDGLVDRGDGTRVSTVNSAFTAASDPVERTLTLTATRFTFPPGTVYLAVFLTWPATNEHVDGFIIGGSFIITPPSGPAVTGALTDLALTPPPPAAP
ncbi:hypothetical protein NVV95_14085 [Herbiconiux sp. CPCC 205716]|uniref:Uncharacterized protein n=1 Tax=Herbiconiux gentiana TaxID=2970912 RepID=A0ABT2GHH7_9MICO|nr:hypothetical protein [Herbiconiux gentiana]MCS5715676.1 hypothetical protein [Herbiconiux gentiana]